MKLTLPRWYDLHVHVRQGPAMADYIDAHLSMGCAGILAMPNTKPPVGKILKSDNFPYWSIEEYRDMILKSGGDRLQQLIVPLYLTRDTTPAMIESGAKTGLLRACKYYPPHGTTNADHGRPLQSFIDNGVFQAMQDHNIVLCLHGEEHGLSGSAYFDKQTNAEEIFYRERLPRVRDLYPDLKIVCEHITTRTAVDFVEKSGDKTGATITPQHLLYTVGDLLQGLKYHLYCLPLVKYADDRDALRAAIRGPYRHRFFAGTDSAPHTQKATACGCAAGCFTGGIAPQLYAESFVLPDEAKVFEDFLCHHGPAFYALAPATGHFTLHQTSAPLKPLMTCEGETVTPLPLGLGRMELPWSLS